MQVSHCGGGVVLQVLRHQPRHLFKALPGCEAAAFQHDASIAVLHHAQAQQFVQHGPRPHVAADAGVVLEGSGFAPRQGFEEMSWLMAQNLQDHAAAAVANLNGEGNFLEQAVFVDELTAESATRLQQVSVQAWKAAFKTVMQEAQARFDGDAASAPPQARTHRARFGVYFYSEREN